MKNQLNALLLTAALSGLVGGTVAAHAATSGSTNANSGKVVKAGLRYSGSNAANADKHSCKGKNDCKGQGGCNRRIQDARTRLVLPQPATRQGSE